MDEHFWITSDNTDELLQGLGAAPSKRKARLFACGCCREIWHLITDARARAAVEASEVYADRAVTQREMLRIRKTALSAPNTPAHWAAHAASRPVLALPWIADLARFALVQKGPVSGHCYNPRPSKSQSDLLRDIFGNPFRAVRIDPSWLACKDQILVKLAQAIYDERAFDRLPILADALEDAGCTDADILGHCRSPGPHVRGCWVVDLLLGKS
jgi:hypothetical protein